MATNILSLYGTSNQSISITLASLATSATVGREATAISNSVNLWTEVNVVLWFETGTVSGNKRVLLYASGSADGGTTYGEGLTGSDAAFTRKGTAIDETMLRGPFVIKAVTNSYVHKTPPIPIAATFFNGVLPDKWTIVVFNDTGAAFSATGGNNKAYYQGVSYQAV